MNCSSTSSPSAPTTNTTMSNATTSSSNNNTNSNNTNNLGNKSYISYPPTPFPPHIMPHGQILTAHPIVTPPPAHLPIMATHQTVLATPPPHPHMHPPPPSHPGMVNQSSQPPPPNAAAMGQQPIHVQPTIISPNQNQNIIHGINQPLREHNLTSSHVQSHLPPHGVPHIHQQGTDTCFYLNYQIDKLVLFPNVSVHAYCPTFFGEGKNF